MSPGELLVGEGLTNRPLGSFFLLITGTGVNGLAGCPDPGRFAFWYLIIASVCSGGGLSFRNGSFAGESKESWEKILANESLFGLWFEPNMESRHVVAVDVDALSRECGFIGEEW